MKLSGLKKLCCILLQKNICSFETLRLFGSCLGHRPQERGILALVLISYIQPFMDGNKRTARIISNSILIHGQFCPISFRTVDSIDYKKAMLLFYEQNNITAFKQIFMQQFEFAVKTYF